MHTNEYTTIDVSSATVTTVVPYTDGAELREYDVDGDELAAFIADMADPEHSERVVDVSLTS